eukprot:406596-Hanusia_phi.AAC.2
MSGTISNNQEAEFKPFGLPKLSEFPSEANERDESVEEVLRYVDDDCKFVRTGVSESGEPEVTSYPKDYFVKTLQKTKPGVLSEELEQPFVQVNQSDQRDYV